MAELRTSLRGEQLRNAHAIAKIQVNASRVAYEGIFSTVSSTMTVEPCGRTLLRQSHTSCVGEGRAAKCYQTCGQVRSTTVDRPSDNAATAKAKLGRSILTQ